MRAIIAKLKDNKEDFELYPTTDEIIFKMVKDIRSREGSYKQYHNRFRFESILDIGAGTGKVLKMVNKVFENNIKMYAIEKANTLKQLLDENVYIIGTDFHQQSLIDKTIDVTFCNPPYSEFKKWTCKIIKESCSQYIYLVIPTRWKDSPEIQEALKYREAEKKILGEFSFKNSNDRQARAVVNLVRIQLPEEKNDAFQRFFNEEFKELKEKFEEKKDPEEERGGEDKKNKFAGLVLGKDYVKNLVQMYDNEIKQIKKNYLYVKELDADLLKEFDIHPAKILNLLQERLKNLKILYWKELISRMKEITDRLISKKRQELLNTLNENGHVDFTENNIYAVVLWILEHAGKYIDDQLLLIYSDMINKANCKNYKSNKRVFEYDRWRYNQEKPTHIFLDYRLVLHYCGGFDMWCSGECKYRLDERACEYLQDVLTIANNLGFKTETDDHRLYRWGHDKMWYPGKPQEFECWYKGKRETLMEIKVHKNGNIHVRMNQKFALALNVEYGRLKGWVHSGKEAAAEMQDLNAAQYFKTNYTLLTSPFMQIEHKPEPTPKPINNKNKSERLKPLIEKAKQLSLF